VATATVPEVAFKIPLSDPITNADVVTDVNPVKVVASENVFPDRVRLVPAANVPAPRYCVNTRVEPDAPPTVNVPVGPERI
jgi:hypothetical protein